MLGEDNWTALHFAAAYENGDIIQELLYYKADANAKDILTFSFFIVVTLFFHLHFVIQ